MKKTFILSMLCLMGIVPMQANFMGETSSIENITAGDHQKITVTSNIPYREGNSKSWLLDLAEPVNFGEEGLRPAIVIVHGGGWRAGSKHHPVYRDLLIDYALQ